MSVKGDYLSISEFSKMIGVPARTVKDWDITGKFRAAKHSAGGHRFYLYGQVEEYRRLKEDRIPTRDFARIVGVAEHTVWTWKNDGKIVPIELEGRRSVFYSAAQLEESLLFMTDVLWTADFRGWLRRYLDDEEYSMFECIRGAVPAVKAVERTGRMECLLEASCEAYLEAEGGCSDEIPDLFRRTVAALRRQRAEYAGTRTKTEPGKDVDLRQKLLYLATHMDELDPETIDAISNSGVAEIADDIKSGGNR